MLGVLLLGVLGLATIGLGVKGFTTEGIPFTSTIRIRGVGGAIAGVFCLTLGLAMLAGAAVRPVMYLLQHQPYRPPTPTVFTESAEERRDETLAAFTASADTSATSVTDPAVLAEVERLFAELRTAMTNRDEQRVIRLFDAEMLYGAMKESLGAPLPLSPREEREFVEGVRQGMGGAALKNWGHLGWDHLELRRVVSIKDDEELLVYVRHRDSTGLGLKMRWWVARRDGEWRIYDLEELDGGLRASTMMAIITAQLGPRAQLPPWMPDLQKLLTAVPLLAAGDVENGAPIVEQVNSQQMPPPIRSLHEVMLSSVRLFEGRFAESLDHADAAQRLHGDMVITNFQRGAALNGLGRHDEAIGALQQYVDQVGDDGVAFLQLGIAHAALGDAEAAVAAFDRGLADMPGDVDLIAEWAPLLPEERRVEIADEVASMPDASLFSGLADVFVNAGDDASLAAAIEGHRRNAPDDPWLVYYDAVLRYWRADYMGAAVALFDALDRAASIGAAADFQTFYLQSMCAAGRPIEGFRAARDQHAAFITVANELIAVENPRRLAELTELYAASGGDPFHLDYFRGEWLLMEERFGDAAEAYRAAISHAGDEALRDEAQSAYFYAMHRAGRSLDAYVEATDKADAFGRLAQLAVDDGATDMLKALLERRRSESPGDPRLARFTVDAAWMDGRHDDVATLISLHRNHIQASEPDQIVVLEARIIRSLLRLHRFEEALAEAKASTDRDGDPYFLVLVHAVQGEAEATEPHLRRCIELGYTYEQFAADDDIGPALQTPAFAMLRQRYETAAP